MTKTITHEVQVHPGRPTKYREPYGEALIHHMTQGASMTSFAAELGVSRDTLAQWAKTNPEFSVSIKRGKAACAAWWENRLRHLALTGQGSAAAIIFALKNMAAEEWRDKPVIEELAPTSTEMTEEQTRLLADLSDEALHALMVFHEAAERD